MALYINTTKVGSTAYMGSTKLNKIKFNGTDVWTGLPPYYNELKNGTVLTQAQWLEFLNGGGVSAIINNNDQNSFIGKIVKINNSQASTYNKWILADFNHDNTSNTVDLINQAYVYRTKYNNNAGIVSYSDSLVRTYLNDTYLPSFDTEIKNKLITMLVKDQGGNVNDKIKSLNPEEVGAELLTAYGEYYPIFYKGNIESQTRVKTGPNGTGYWWLRGYTSTSGGNIVYYANEKGLVASVSASIYAGVVPCIRMS